MRSSPDSSSEAGWERQVPGLGALPTVERNFTDFFSPSPPRPVKEAA